MNHPRCHWCVNWGRAGGFDKLRRLGVRMEVKQHSQPNSSPTQRHPRGWLPSPGRRWRKWSGTSNTPGKKVNELEETHSEFSESKARTSHKGLQLNCKVSSGKWIWRPMDLTAHGPAAPSAGHWVRRSGLSNPWPDESWTHRRWKTLSKLCDTVDTSKSDDSKNKNLVFISLS